MTEIKNVDAFLLSVLKGQIPRPRRYELRCHPDVFLALQEASAASPEWTPSVNAGVTGLYGSADVIVRPDLGSGGWELYADGELLNSGRLGEVTPF